MQRRQFLARLTKAGLSLATSVSFMAHAKQIEQVSTMGTNEITLFLCGDVMTGRGIDQVLPFPSDPRLYEPYVNDANDYVALAERVNGVISKPIEFDYIWGDALVEFDRRGPDARIVNLETSITSGGEHWPGKGIHYRMHPKNIPCLTAADIDCCVLANNHVLDWGYDGLEETLATLRDAGIKTAGAGRNNKEASSPAIIELAKHSRVIVFSYGVESSGVPYQWTAADDKPGVNLLLDISAKTVRKIAQQIESVKRPGDIVVASLHWGANWGYRIPEDHIQFAHGLIDLAGVDVAHGHSSHHPIGIEVYNGKPILFGCGDFLNDYEGISGYEAYRDDLTLMYFVRMEVTTGKLLSLEMAPMQIRQFRLNRASNEDVVWLQKTLDRECSHFNGGIELTKDHALILRWQPRRMINYDAIYD